MSSGSMTDGRRSGGVVRPAGARLVHLVLAALGRLVGVRRSLLIAHGICRRGVGRVTRFLDAGSLDVLLCAFRGLLRVYHSSLIARSSLDGMSSSSVPGPVPAVTAYSAFRMKMVRKM
jgi:hypothetical protein